MKIVSRDEVIKALIEDMKVFEKIISKKEVKGENEDNKDNLLARIKNGPTQLAMMGLLPYITFIVSKYEPEKDKQGYTRFLVFLIYILNKLKIIELKNEENENIMKYMEEYDNIRNSKTNNKNEIIEGLSKTIKEFLIKVSGLSEGQKRILEKDMLVILEEMKKIYSGLYDSSE